MYAGDFGGMSAERLDIIDISFAETELDNHLGYDRYERSGEPNYRNGTKPKTDVPQDRQISFEPHVSLNCPNRYTNSLCKIAGRNIIMIH